MKELEAIIRGILNKSVSGMISNNPKQICWDFCRIISSNLGVDLPIHPYEGLKKVDKPSIGCVVLFQIGKEWHSGIVWPDCLHFVHACPEKKNEKMQYVARKSRLTLWPWNVLFEGFYEHV